MGRFVRITRRQRREMDDKVNEATAAKRKRQPGAPSAMPPTMQQACFSLAVHAKRRSVSDVATMSIPEIEVHLERLEDLWAEIEKEWRTLRSIINSEAAMETIGSEYARHLEMYMEFKSMLRAKLAVLPANSCSTPAPAMSSTAISVGPTGQTIQIQLSEPASIPQFSGRDEDWAHFRSAFVAEVHSCSRFNDLQKLRHLLGAVRGRAKNILGDWTLDSGGSYMQAWQGLCNSYDNEYNTIQTHLRKIDALQKLQRPTGAAIRKVLDTVRSAHRQLRILLTPELVAEHLLMHRIEAALDTETITQWSLRRAPSTLPTLHQMYEFLELRASALFGRLGETGRPNDGSQRGMAVTMARGADSKQAHSNATNRLPSFN